ncbi:MAG: IS66 family transposase zinc-finger binding domain-containing protein, partial [Nitrosomonas sp.]|nr:IS66 family transposase zinc-finger binding domain-containing protein [Nitrosomonas sp.]
MGEDVTEPPAVKPAEFSVHRHIRPQYACRTCETLVVKPATRRHQRRYGNTRTACLDHY